MNQIGKTTTTDYNLVFNGYRIVQSSFNDQSILLKICGLNKNANGSLPACYKSMILNQRAESVSTSSYSRGSESVCISSGSTGNGAMLYIQDADLGYGSKVILHITRLALKIGEKISLVGPSGCGKTTLLSVIAGSSELLRGRIEFGGAPRDSHWRVKHVARTLQAFPLLHWLTVRQNLQLAYRIRQSRSDDKEAQNQAHLSDIRVDEILLQLSASHLADLYPKQLSGGERCRASLAQSVIGNPRILLLDEPFTGLDLLVKKDVAQTIFSFAERNSISVIFVTHDLDDAAAFSDRVVVLGQHPVTQIVADIPVAGAATAADVETILKERA